MSDFEFLTILVSIVIGLALTRLLGGLGHAYHFRSVSKMDIVHVAWTITVFFAVILNWWVFLLWRDFDAWNFSAYFLVLMWTTAIYMMAVALYPPRLAEDANYGQLFEDNRTWLLSTFGTFCALDIIVTRVRDHAWPDLIFMAFVGHYIAICFLAIIIKNRKLDLFLAWWIAGTLAIWSFGVRHTLF